MYFGCHNHTEDSNITTGLDSINRLGDIVAKAKALGLSGLAITEHDNLCGAMDINLLQKKLKKENDDFVLAIGNEIYLLDTFDPELKERRKYYHAILIAKDKIGYDALVKLSSRAWYRSTIVWGKRRVVTLKSDIEEILQEAKGHLVMTTACLGGEYPSLINAGEMGAANAFLDWGVDVFGYDDFYVELQPSRIKEQIAFNKIAESAKVKKIIATDSHYQDPDDFPVFEAFLRSQKESREVKEYYEFARLMGEEEIYSLMDENGISAETVEECLRNTLNIQNSIQFYDLEQTIVVPEVPATMPEFVHEVDVSKYPTLSWAKASAEKDTQAVYRQCINSLVEKGIDNELYLERLEHEFDVFKYQGDELNQNFFSYFVVMRYYIDMAWSIDCAVGPSRGSASGSLLCYLMEIVQCDPIEYDLPFWRFAHKFRVSTLDIDSDFQPSKKPDLFAAIRKERGELGLLQVATFRKLTLKAAIGNAGRGYRSKEFPNGLDPDTTAFLSSLIEIKRGFVATLEQTLHGDETTGYNINHTFIKECKGYPGLIEIIQKIEGLIVGSSTHAAAVIFFDEEKDPYYNHCALMRSPNGDLCTCFDLSKVEMAGTIKYDFLLLSTLDSQATCFKLLQADGVIDSSLTLKECFRKYINPNTVDMQNASIWKHLYNNDVLSVFQWDQSSGRKGVLAANPQSLAELTALNALIRLMAPDEGEDQITRFTRIKNSPEDFEREMVENEVPRDVRDKMHAELDKYNGCAAMQENFMVLVQNILGYSLKEADILRKVVAKKKMKEITAQREFFDNKANHLGFSRKMTDYLYNTIVAPSLGYAFSVNHSTVYSIIGIQCILLGAVLFPSIYWQSACLLQRSGALDNKGVDYNKIAKAVAALSSQGVNILPLHINKSQQNFTHDASSNSIYFGFSATKGMKSSTVEEIVAQRPFNSFEDLIKRVKLDVATEVALVKSGALDCFGDRLTLMRKVAAHRADTKKKLNGQNLLMISRHGLWDESLSEYVRIFNFTQYLKKNDYNLDDKCIDFLDSIDYEYSGLSIDSREWKEFYDKMVAPLKQFLADNQEEMLSKLNTKIEKEWLEKYFTTEIFGEWEIQTLGTNFSEHPYANVEKVQDFNELSQTPEIRSFFRTKSGANIPLFDLTMIAGIVIAKDKMHSTITIQTTTGPVDVKFKKEQFAFYDNQVSIKVGDKKKVIEKSWFSRGVGLLVHGMRRDDLFVAKTYKNSPMKHTVYRIDGLTAENKFNIIKERKRGKMEESHEE